jgi:hypothetical protein
MGFVQNTVGMGKTWKSIHKDNMRGKLSIDEAKIRLALKINVRRFGG